MLSTFLFEWFNWCHNHCKIMNFQEINITNVTINDQKFGKIVSVYWVNLLHAGFAFISILTLYQNAIVLPNYLSAWPNWLTKWCGYNHLLWKFSHGKTHTKIRNKINTSIVHKSTFEFRWLRALHRSFAS